MQDATHQTLDGLEELSKNLPCIVFRQYPTFSQVVKQIPVQEVFENEDRLTGRLEHVLELAELSPRALEGGVGRDVLHSLDFGEPADGFHGPRDAVERGGIGEKGADLDARFDVAKRAADVERHEREEPERDGLREGEREGGARRRLGQVDRLLRRRLHLDDGYRRHAAGRGIWRENDEIERAAGEPDARQ